MGWWNHRLFRKIKNSIMTETSSNKRFDLYTLKLAALMAKAEKQSNPSYWLYKNDARTPLFMLEGLGKLFSHVSNAKKYTKVRNAAKLIEDAIGQIDYWEALAADLGKLKKIDAKYIQYAKAKCEQAQQACNKLLLDNGWIKAENKRVNKINEWLSDCKVLSAEKEAKKIHTAMQECINKSIESIKATNFTFTLVEDHLHKTRRILRWISIYAKALNGMIQYDAKVENPAILKKYLTPSVVKSPFNKMAPIGSNTHVVCVQKNYFLALSWLIAELGVLKDSGLKALSLAAVIAAVDKLDEKKGLTQAYKLLGAKQAKTTDILKKSSALCKKFFDEKVMEHVLSNIVAFPLKIKK